MATIDDVIDTDEFEPLEIESIDDEERNGLLQNTEVQAAPHSSQSCGMKELFISLISMAAISFILAVVITSKKDSTATDPSEEISLYPKALLQNVYHKVDFENKKHIIPPYWKDAELKTFQEGALPHLGPCYLPKEEQDWLSLVEKNEQIRGKHNIKYRDGIKKRRDDSDNAKDLSGLCRPGFIIIGAGKCGTSSLYHYLVGHDRVLPAKNKQIHYFKYWKSYPMKWYLSNFPPAETFLSNGALMTGEASPGYLVSFIYVCRLLRDSPRSIQLTWILFLLLLLAVSRRCSYYWYLDAIPRWQRRYATSRLAQNNNNYAESFGKILVILQL
jgi:hypothetical protein